MRKIFERSLWTFAIGLFIGLMTTTTCFAQQSKNFQGVWTWKKGAEEFELRLRRDGNRLTGFHLSIGQDGNKVDEADLSQEPSIVGKIKGGTATVRFKSAFPDSDGQGTATLILRGKRLYWRIENSSGEHYLPKYAVMKKSKSN